MTAALAQDEEVVGLFSQAIHQAENGHGDLDPELLPDVDPPPEGPEPPDSPENPA